MKTKYALAIFAFLTIAYSFSMSANKGDEKHYGKVTTALGVYEGEFNLKLNDENGTMMEIKLVDIKQKSKGEKIKYTESVSVNCAIVRTVETEGYKFILKNIAKEDGSSFKNCCLRVTDSSAVANLAYWGTDSLPAKCFVITKYNNAYQPLKSIFYFTFSSLFSKCPSIKEKMKQQPENYRKTFENLSQEERLALWKTNISEYNNCFK